VDQTLAVIAELCENDEEKYEFIYSVIPQEQQFIEIRNFALEKLQSFISWFRETNFYNQSVPISPFILTNSSNETNGFELDHDGLSLYARVIIFMWELSVMEDKQNEDNNFFVNTNSKFNRSWIVFEFMIAEYLFGGFLNEIFWNEQKLGSMLWNFNNHETSSLIHAFVEKTKTLHQRFISSFKISKEEFQSIFDILLQKFLALDETEEDQIIPETQSLVSFFFFFLDN